MRHRRGEWYVILPDPPRNTARQLPRGQQGLFVTAVSLKRERHIWQVTQRGRQGLKWQAPVQQKWGLWISFKYKCHPWSWRIFVADSVSDQMKVFTTSYTIVVEHHSLVAAELKFLQSAVTRQNWRLWHRNIHLSQEGARWAYLLKHLPVHTHTHTYTQKHTNERQKWEKSSCLSKCGLVTAQLMSQYCTCRLMLCGQLTILRLNIWPKWTLKSEFKERLSVLETSLSLYRILMKRERLVTSSLRAVSGLKTRRKHTWR